MRPVRERLADERRHDAAVVDPHARAVGVENPDDARLDLVLAMVGHRQRLGETLGLVVAAARADGADVAPVFLGLRMHERVAVNFRGRGDQKSCALVLRQAERLVRAERADLERLDGNFQVVNRAGRRGEMPDVIHRAVEENKLGDVLLDELEIPVAAEVRDVVHRAGDKIVEADDLVAARQKQIGEVRAEKAGGAGDDGGGLFVFQAVEWLNCQIVELSGGKIMAAIQPFDSSRFTSRPCRAGRRRG